jgi:hypothetical protein
MAQYLSIPSGSAVAELGTSATRRGEPEKEKFMESAGQEVGRIETRLRQLGTKLDKLMAKAGEVETEAKIEYRKQLDHIKEKHAVVQSKLTAFRTANGQKWDNFKGGVETAWQDLENALKALKD